MNDRKRVKVLLVDDHPVVLVGLAGIISTQGDLELVGQGANGAEAIRLFDAASPDVTVVDLSLPDINGSELITILRAKAPMAKFVVLSANMSGNDVARAVQAGAHSYVFKDAPSGELVAAIRMVARGGRMLSPSAGSKLDELAGRPELTARELEVLEWMVRGHSNQKIGEELGVAEETVKTHVKKILRKLSVSSRVKAVAFSLKSGLVRSDGK